MRVVIDTNVFVSALLIPGSLPGEVVQRALARRYTWFVDSRIMAEYRLVAARPHLRIPQAETAVVLDFPEHGNTWVTGEPVGRILPDETDRPFVEVAIAASAHFIVTGNKKHFPFTKQDFGFDVVTPREFLERMSEI